MIRSYLATYDYNLPLHDAEEDSDLNARRRTMAAIGCHVPLDSGYYDAQALAAALIEQAREANDGVPDTARTATQDLQDLLDRDNRGYQTALIRLVALVPTADAVADLCWFADLMRVRADMARPLHALGLAPALPGR